MDAILLSKIKIRLGKKEKDRRELAAGLSEVGKDLVHMNRRYLRPSGKSLRSIFRAAGVSHFFAVAISPQLRLDRSPATAEWPALEPPALVGR